MAIQLYCPSCKTYVPTATKKCPKCSLIFSREGRRYRVDVTFKGQRVTRFCENLTLARELEGVIRGDLVRGEYQIVDHHARKAVTLDDVWAKYLPWAKEHKKTWDDDSYHYSKHLAPRFGNKPLKDITPFEIEKLKLDLKKGLNAHGKHYAPATIKHQIVLLRRLYNVAKKWGMYDGNNPVGQVQMPNLDNQVTEFMTDEQAENLLAVLETWPCRDSAAFVKFAMLTGFRRGELFKLKWGNVDLERGFITLQKPKGGKTVTLPISDQALSVLKSLLLHGTESQGEVDQDSYVFPGKDGKQRADFKGPWQRIREAAGLPETFRFHGLRHNFASHLVSNGVDLTVVGELLTHKSTATTQRYAHLLPTAVQEAARKSGELLTGKRGGRVVAFKEG